MFIIKEERKFLLRHLVLLLRSLLHFINLSKAFHEDVCLILSDPSSSPLESLVAIKCVLHLLNLFIHIVNSSEHFLIVFL